MRVLRKEYEELPLYKRILSGVCYLRKQARLANRGLQEITIQIESRNSDWKSEWNTPEDIPIVEIIGKRACELFGWPAVRFIPDDPHCLIFCEDVDDLAEVDLAICCEQEFGISLNDFIRSTNNETTLNDLVIEIRRLLAINTDAQ